MPFLGRKCWTSLLRPIQLAHVVGIAPHLLNPSVNGFPTATQTGLRRPWVLLDGVPALPLGAQGKNKEEKDPPSLSSQCDIARRRRVCIQWGSHRCSHGHAPSRSLSCGGLVLDTLLFWLCVYCSGAQVVPRCPDLADCGPRLPLCDTVGVPSAHCSCGTHGTSTSCEGTTSRGT